MAPAVISPVGTMENGLESEGEEAVLVILRVHGLAMTSEGQNSGGGSDRMAVGPRCLVR